MGIGIDIFILNHETDVIYWMSQSNQTCSQCFNNTLDFLDKNCVKNMLPTIKAVPGVKTLLNCSK